MEPNIWFWVWLALAVILSIAEIFTAGFFLLPFGIGAAVAAFLEYFAPGSIGWQWAAFIGVSSLLLVVLRRIANRITHEPPQKVAGDRLIGKDGVVIETLEDHSPRGRVRVQREEWRADAPGFEPLPEGTPITVVAVEGTHLVVRPATRESAESE
jgi:membrane protein implicated in regulation of membrane protease activity